MQSNKLNNIKLDANFEGFTAAMFQVEVFFFFCDALWCCGRIPTFQRSVLPPSAWWSGGEDGGSVGLWKVGVLPEHCTASKPRKLRLQMLSFDTFIISCSVVLIYVPKGERGISANMGSYCVLKHWKCTHKFEATGHLSSITLVVTLREEEHRAWLDPTEANDPLCRNREEFVVLNCKLLNCSRSAGSSYVTWWNSSLFGFG